MTAEELIEKYVSGHAECRWMDACDLDDLLHAFVKELGSLAVPSNLDEAAEEYEHNLGYYECMNQWPSVAFKAGAEWAANEFENNRLKACEALSEEDYKLESDFVDAHIKKNHRTPTFLDAIKYGAEWMAGQGTSMEITELTEWADVDSFVHRNCDGESIIQIRKK